MFFDPGNGEDIIVLDGYKVSVFAKGLNFPTAVAFKGNKNKFEVHVLESGHGLPSRCNDEALPVFGGVFSASNPMTPDILVFDQAGNKVGGPLAEPTGNPLTGVQTGGLQAHGLAIDIAFENGFQGGRLFATDSNQAIRAVGVQNNSSRIVTVDPGTGQVTPFITGLPTGDHPAEQITFGAMAQLERDIIRERVARFRHEHPKDCRTTLEDSPSFRNNALRESKPVALPR